MEETNNDYKPIWHNQQRAYNEALSYIYKRSLGEIKSFKTPWPKVNDAGVDGLEWNSLTIIAARPGAGKTLMKDQIVREIDNMNPDQKIRVLEFQFEMLARASKVREFSSIIGKPYKYVCSASNEREKRITNAEFKSLVQYVENKKSLENSTPVDIVENPISVEEIRDTIEHYMEMHSYTELDKQGKPQKKYVNTLITLDHTMLVKVGSNESNKMEMLSNLGEMCTQVKRKYPIAFILLSQLNRNMEERERSKEGTYGNYINSSDIYGSDAILQHADMVIAINKPSQFCIRWYGPEKYLIEDDKTLVLHFLKCRTGEIRMSFFKAEFDKMRIVEMKTPITKDGYDKDDTEGEGETSKTSSSIRTKRH